MIRITGFRILIAVILMISISTGCGKKKFDTELYLSNKEILDSFTKMDLSHYKLIYFDENNQLVFQSVDSIRINKLREGQIGSIIKVTMKIIGAKGFTYNKDQYTLFCFDTPLHCLLHLITEEDQDIDLGNFNGNMKYMLSRNESQITPFAEKLNDGWYYVEINETI